MKSWLQGRRAAMFIPALTIAQIAAALESNMIYAATPAMNRAFSTTTGGAWVPTACLVVGAASAAVCGRLGDLFGRRRVLMIILAIAAAGSALSANAPTLGWLIAGGALQGAVGSTYPLTLALVRENVKPDRVAWVIGIMASGASIAAASGLFLGGLLVDHVGWHGIFIATGSWAAFSCLLIWVFVPHTIPAGSTSKGLDLLTGVLFAPAIAVILISLNFVKTVGWGDLRIIGGLVGSFLLLAYWWRRQYREENPLIDVRLITHPETTLALMFGALIGLGTMQQNLIMSLMMQQPTWTGVGLGLTATAAGMFLVLPKCAGIVGSVAGGRITVPLGAANVVLLGAAMTVAGWVMVMLFPGNLVAILIGLAIEGAAYPIMSNGAYTALLQLAPSHRAGEVTGLQAVIRSIAAAVGIQVLMFLFRTSTVTSAGKPDFPSLQAYQWAIAFIILASFVCGLLAWRLDRLTKGAARDRLGAVHPDPVGQTPSVKSEAS